MGTRLFQNTKGVVLNQDRQQLENRYLAVAYMK